MQKDIYTLIVMFTLFLSVGLGLTSSQVIGSAVMYAPAVLLTNNIGTLTRINLTIYNGNGIVNVIGPLNVGSSTNQSANIAVKYATNLLNLDYSHYKFVYSIKDNTSNVSGPSAGAAMTILAISALSYRKLRDNFTMTGTINPKGTIGQIGGVYDKAGAAHYRDMNFIMVPKVQNGSFEEQLYLLTQKEFGIPLVQVSNISQAEYFAFGTNNASENMTKYSFYVNYHINTIPNAGLNCTDSCNISAFKGLQQYTLNISNSAVNLLVSQPKFTDVGNELLNVNSETKILASKGYLYMAADIEFLNYLNTVIFINHNTSISDGLTVLNNTSIYCSNLNSPKLTNTNYDYVIGAQLRNGWGVYTINTINALNKSKMDTDLMLTLLKNGAEAHAWCGAADFMYNQSKRMGGYSVSYMNSLKNMAKNRLSRASAYPGMYLSTANILYNKGDYGAAIIDADYVYSFSNTSKAQNMSASKLNGLADSIAKNSTYGVWATQFANEALFYVYQSNMDINSSLAHDDALSAYQSAVLASQISNDTLNIYNNLIRTTSSTTTTLPTTIVSKASTTTYPILVYQNSRMDYFALSFSISAFIISVIAGIIASLAYHNSKKRIKPKRIKRRRKK